MKLARLALEPHQSRDFRLDVVDAERQSDGWWHVIFRPSVPGMKAYEYEGRVVEAMMDIREKYKTNAVFLEESLADAH
jgi:hypothetical protein